MSSLALSSIKLTKLPETCGVYLFKNKTGNILYIGKANNLRIRIKSYFAGTDTRPKIKFLLPQISNIQTIEVESEFEALLLESALIKKHQPKYNSIAKDDKHPLYIAITKEEFPKVKLIRKTQDIGPANIFGPFPSSHTVHQVLKFLRKTFPYCSCKNNKGKPCLYASIKLCQPCPRNIVKNQLLNKNENQTSSTKTQYQKQMRLLAKLLSGQAPQVLKTLKKEMNKTSNRQNYEQAIFYRDGLFNLQRLLQPNRSATSYLENSNLRREIREQASFRLQQILNNNKIHPPIENLSRIECYDISTLNGKFSTGSMIVFTNGEPHKSQYRKFKIKKEGKPNDIAMISEMLTRRFNQTFQKYQNTKISKKWALPNLILIDGGLPQLNIVIHTLKLKKLKIPVIGLAKRQEEIYISTLNNNIIKICLPKTNLSLQLLQHLRDEAHRFANKYRKKLIANQFNKN